MTDKKAGQRFLTWLAAAAIEARERAGARREDVASAAGGGYDKIRRVESAQTLPQNAEHGIAAYAAIAGLPDSRDIYERALALWREHGLAPALHDDDLTTGQAFERGIRVRRAPPPASDEHAGTTTGTRRRRAG